MYSRKEGEPPSTMIDCIQMLMNALLILSSTLLLLWVTRRKRYVCLFYMTADLILGFPFTLVLCLFTVVVRKSHAFQLANFSSN